MTQNMDYQEPPIPPVFVAHYGMERTVFTWRPSEDVAGAKIEVEGYCGWRNGRIYKIAE